MGFNLAELSDEEMEKINMDLLASGIAFKERYDIPVHVEAVVQQQPESLRDYFRERIAHYRKLSQNFDCMPYEPKLGKNGKG